MSSIGFCGKSFDIPSGYFAVATRAVTAGVPNLNRDYFPPEVLEDATETYIDCPRVFVDHRTDFDDTNPHLDKTFSRGYVKDAVYEDGVLYLLIFVSKKFKDLAEALIGGEINAVSMGCECSITCSICGEEDCPHLEKLAEGYLEGDNYEILSDVEFVEISFVFEPADPTALIYKVVW